MKREELAHRLRAPYDPKRGCGVAKIPEPGYKPADSRPPTGSMIESVLCVIPCGKRKIWEKFPALGAVPAREAYTRGLAKAAREYAARFYRHWVVLSARHGFLFPDELVPGPYDATFLRPGDKVISERALKLQVKTKGLRRFRAIDVVAGSVYCRKVQLAFSDHKVKLRPVLAGMRGMGFIQQAMRRALKRGVPIRPRFRRRSSRPPAPASG